MPILIRYAPSSLTREQVREETRLALRAKGTNAKGS